MCKRCLAFRRIKMKGTHQVSALDYDRMPPHTCELRKD